MSDFGSEAGTAAIQITGQISIKLLEAIMALIKKSYEDYEKSHTFEIQKAKEQLKEAPNEAAKWAVAKEMDGMAGYARYKELVNIK